jgi:hypothetical protein
MYAVGGWVIFCVLDAPRFMKAEISHIAISLAINALRNIMFWVAQILFCIEEII